MKKFFACFLILAVFFVFIFCLGWTQFRLKPDMVGVVISKTNGIAEKPVLNGEFSWYWQFLLPTNAKLKTFSIKPVNVEKSVKGQLQSGQVYTSIFSVSDTFDYDFTFSISVTLGPDHIISLLKENVISDDNDLTEYLNKAADTIAQLATDFYLKKAQDNPSFRPESVRREDLLRAIQLYKDFPEVDLLAFAVKSSKIPDYKLYQKLQSQFLTGQADSLTGAEYSPEDSLENSLSENPENPDEKNEEN